MKTDIEKTGAEPKPEVLISEASINFNQMGSQVIRMPFIENRFKEQTKEATNYEMECKVNFVIVEQPAGPFTDSGIRNGFIRKVYGILSVQIAFTVICSAIMYTFFRDKLNLKELDKNNDRSGILVVIILTIISTVVVIGVMVTFCCSKSIRRSVPINFILLGLFTIAETFLVGFSCAQRNGESILIAFVITGVVVLSITLLATTPWFDITHCGCLLFILFIIHLAMSLIVVMVVMIFNVRANYLYLALSIAGAFLFSLYLLYDTQLILGGKKYEMSPEEYIYGAICLYIDIIMIFLNILGISSNSN